MLVSAISENTLPITLRAFGADSDKYSDNINKDSSYNNSRFEDIYNRINEWKYFCHKQILQGKLDIIA